MKNYANMLKNGGKSLRKNLIERRRAIFFTLVIVSIVLISLVILPTVLSSKNVGTYDSKEQTVTIMESFLDRAVVAEITLNTPLVNHVIRGKDRLVAEFTIVNDEKDFTKIFNNMEFYNLNDEERKFNKEFTYRYKKSTGFKTIEDYDRVCREEFNSFNQTYEDICEQEVVGTHEEEMFKWVELERSEDVPLGEITIGIFTDVEAGESIEWIPTLYDIRISAWAVWTEALNTDLWAYYTFNESSGTNVDNAVGNATRDGTANNIGDIDWTTGKIGNGLYLAGTNEDIELGADPLSGLATDFAIVWWERRNDTSDSRQSLGFEDSGAGPFQFGTSATKMNALASTTGGDWDIISPWNLDAGAPTAGAFVNWAITRTGTNWTIYKNGVVAVSKVAAGTIGNDGVSFRIGSTQAGGQFFYGIMDEMGIWNRSLSQTEVTQIYNGGAGITYGVVAVEGTLLDVNLTSPSNNTIFISSTRDFVGNYTYDIMNITNATYYMWNSTNNEVNKTTVIVNPAVNGSTANIGNFSIGNHTWNIYACGINITDTHCDWADVNHSFEKKIFIETLQNFSSSALERSSQTFSLNITYDSITYPNIQAILKYNNTNYTGIKVLGTGDGAVFNATLTIPSITSKINKTFYWEVKLIDGANYLVNSSFYNQTIDPMLLGLCNQQSVGLYNFTIVDEETQQILLGDSQNTSALVDIELYTLDRTILIANFSQNYTEVNPFSICINDSLAGGETFSLDAQIQYSATFYAKEFYHLQSAIVNSSELAQNITLFDLSNSTSTTFKITYKDDNFLPLVNALIQIQRKYISEGVFKTVEIPKTDSNGETIAHLVEEDAIYTFIIVKDGEIQATFTDFLVKCEDPVLGTCEIELNAFKSHLEPENFIDLDDFLFTLNYNRTTRTVQTIYSIPTGNSATIVLNTTLYDGLGTTEVCHDSLTSSSGTLSCVVPIGFGNTSIINTITKDGVEVARGMVGVQESPTSLYGTNLMFLGFFLILMMVGVGLGSSPMISGVFLIVGAILSLAFNLVANTGFFGYGATILWLIIAVIIVLMKGARRE